MIPPARAPVVFLPLRLYLVCRRKARRPKIMPANPVAIRTIDEGSGVLAGSVATTETSSSPQTPLSFFSVKPIVVVVEVAVSLNEYKV